MQYYTKKIYLENSRLTTYTLDFNLMMSHKEEHKYLYIIRRFLKF